LKNKVIIRNVEIVNENQQFIGDISIEDSYISEVKQGSISGNYGQEFDGSGLLAIPGMIDDQVHFREPGLTHKANIYTESRAAVAGGITSFMEMPNTIPNTVTQKALEEKYKIGSESSIANYSFFMGANNENLDEVLKTNAKNVCGIKVFMGSSTGNMLVDNSETLSQIFKNSPLLIATHCEDEATIRKNTALYKGKYGDNIPFELHPIIRSEEACYLSSSLAVELAKKYESRLHILHISTAKELSLFSNKKQLKDKKITAECCIHHLWFNDTDYKKKKSFIKWNPAVKTTKDREALWEALLDDRIDVIATDHAPHTMEEKANPYTKAPSGGPLVQHAVVALMEAYHKGKISIEKLVEKMAHNPAILFQIEKRGFIREGYFADLILVDPYNPWTVTPENILYKCGWSPFEGVTFKSRITHTILNGNLVYHNAKFTNKNSAMRLTFNR
jgi:dihydroorotase